MGRGGGRMSGADETVMANFSTGETCIDAAEECSGGLASFT